MRFQHVAIAAVAHVDAPNRLSSADIVARLLPAMERLGVRSDLLENVAGIDARRVWNEGTTPSDAAVLAADKVLAETGIGRAQVGMLVNTSVCRDFIEPSTASIVAGKLGLPEHCQNFDVGNACLAFLNGMDIAAHMIERGDIEYALIVDGECSRHITEKTIERLSGPNVTADQFREEFASLTLGSGGVAMVLANAELYPDGHRYLGSVSRSATQFSKLCAGNIDRMVTDTRTLLIEGLKLAGKTFAAARQMFGWAVGEIDEFVIHQVSRVHTEELVKMLGIDPRKVLTIFPEFGNIGPASLPTALSKLNESGRLVKGKRVALLGIGSGLNCSMAEVVW
ncbi:MAG: 3-oxoacyl-ACP synthase III [Xanthomonadales bacterium]|nr:3-oxoacyl-[acyl-carrier-protein] synthase 3 [Xanthomonadales bacterium]MCC6592327.1 3-oxoacyl-ACP synthase III [Xanthomonadales bacterium]MCE7931020.1 3-oxoacyl-ACP synthase III [Xanthomonadales bacterium PRO6]